MPSTGSSATDRDDRDDRDDRLHGRGRRRDWTRRHVLVAGAAAGTALLAGCAGSDQTDGDTTEPVDDTTERTGRTTSDDTSERTGTFRLLVSDRPAAIADFDSLAVSFDRARIFRRPVATVAETSTETPTGTGIPTDTETASSTPTAADATPTEMDDEADTDGQRGFSIVDLDGETVDLTQLVGERASAVFEGELPEGRYTKIELFVADVVGVVDGERAAVKVPSEKLQLTKPFTLAAGEPLSFVFDINVVRKGGNGYNLLPVISESGVAGEDVAVTEVGETMSSPGEATTTASGTTSTATTGEPTDSAGGDDTDRGGGRETGNGATGDSTADDAGGS